MAGDQTALFVGDMGGTIYAINAHTGEPLWNQKVALFEASTATGTPVPYSDESGDRLFVPLSAFGVVLATNPQYECCKSHGAVQNELPALSKWEESVATVVHPSFGGDSSNTTLSSPLLYNTPCFHVVHENCIFCDEIHWEFPSIARK